MYACAAYSYGCLQLFHSIVASRADVVTALLKESVQIDSIIQPYGLSPLGALLERGMSGARAGLIAKLLIDAGAKADVAANTAGQTALQFGGCTGSMMQLLLATKPPPSRKALTDALESHGFMNHTNEIKTLVGARADPIFYAVRTGKSEQVRSYLAAGWEIETAAATAPAASKEFQQGNDECKRIINTHLHQHKLVRVFGLASVIIGSLQLLSAVLKGDEKMITACLARDDVYVNYPILQEHKAYVYRGPALMALVSPDCTLSDKQKLRVAKLLIGKGAKPDLDDSEHNAPLRVLAISVEVLNTLLAASPPPNLQCVDTSFRTALHLHANRGNVLHCRALVDARAALDVFDSDRSTPLLLAMGPEPSKTEVALSLLAAKANFAIADSKGNTALMLAAIHGNTGVVKELIRLKADLDVKATSGSTALEMAHGAAKAEVVHMLLAAGAAISNSLRAACKNITVAPRQRGITAVINRGVTGTADEIIHIHLQQQEKVNIRFAQTVLQFCAACACSDSRRQSAGQELPGPPQHQPQRTRRRQGRHRPANQPHSPHGRHY